MRATRWAAVLAAAVLAGGCGSAREAVRPAGGVDGYRAADVRFYAAFQYPEAAEAEVYGSLDSALRGANAVVLGRVTDVRVTRHVGDPDDPIAMYGVTVEPHEVLRGSLPPEHARAVTVEFVTAAASADELRRALPAGYAVWVLRHKTSLAPGVVAKAPLPDTERGYYRLVSSQALFVQGERHVVNPIEHVHEPEIPMPGQPAHGTARRDPVVVAAESFATLSGLAAHARGV